MSLQTNQNFIVTADAGTNQAVCDVTGDTCQRDASSSSVQNSSGDPDVDSWNETDDNYTERAAEHNKPISIFLDVNAEELAFPNIFWVLHTQKFIV